MRALRKLTTFCNSILIEKELSKLITTPARKKIWIYIDGNRLQPELAELSGVSQPAVSYFLQEVKLAGIIEYPKGRPPYKILDYVPPKWLDLVGNNISIQVEREEYKRRTLNDYEG